MSSKTGILSRKASENISRKVRDTVPIKEYPEEETSQMTEPEPVPHKAKIEVAE